MSRPRIEGQDTWSLTLLIQSEILSRFISLFISSETNRHHQFISSGINRHCRQIQHKEVNLDNNLNVQSYFPVQFTSVLVPGIQCYRIKTPMWFIVWSCPDSFIVDVSYTRLNHFFSLRHTKTNPPPPGVTVCTLNTLLDSLRTIRVDHTRRVSDEGFDHFFRKFLENSLKVNF